MTRPLALLTHALPPEWIASLHDRVNLLVGPVDPPGFAPGLMERLAEAEGVLCLLTDRIDDAILSAAPRLRVISNMAVGVDNIDVAGCSRRGIPVGNTPGVVTDATADLAMGLLLSAARRLHESAADARNGLWRTWSPTGWLGADLGGATLGIVGMGKIGRAVASRALGFGMHITYAGPREQAGLGQPLHAEYLALADLLRASDFVSLHCPLSAGTRGLIGARELRIMKPGAVLVNTSRGPIVDTAALVRALQENWIAGAALDVTDPEPLPPEHVLYSLPNCLVSPHIGSATHGTRRRMAEMACENLLAGLQGSRLLSCANPEIYAK